MKECSLFGITIRGSPKRMKCPHCRTDFHDEPHSIPVGQDADGGWILIRRKCPACGRFILHLDNGIVSGLDHFELAYVERSILVRPKGSTRPPCPPEVPKELAEDYTQACLILVDSPKAAAALGRRCLQHLLRGTAKVKAGNLADEIEQVLNTLPSHLAESIDAIRNIGNFAAHPLKAQNSGEILDVEPHEAEWTLDVLEGLFDFYFVQPAVLKKKRDAMNQKLKAAGKPVMK